MDYTLGSILDRLQEVLVERNQQRAIVEAQGGQLRSMAERIAELEAIIAGLVRECDAYRAVLADHTAAPTEETS